MDEIRWFVVLGQEGTSRLVVFHGINNFFIHGLSQMWRHQTLFHNTMQNKVEYRLAESHAYMYPYMLGWMLLGSVHRTVPCLQRSGSAHGGVQAAAMAVVHYEPACAIFVLLLCNHRNAAGHCGVSSSQLKEVALIETVRQHLDADWH